MPSTALDSELCRFIGSDEQAELLLDALTPIAPGLKLVSFHDIHGDANFGKGTIRLPGFDERLSPLANLVSISQTAAHEAAHFRYTSRDGDALLDKDEQRFAAAGAEASWKQLLGTLMALEDARINESLIRDWPQLELLFRAEGALDRPRREKLDVSGKTYLEYHFGILDATDPYSVPPRGVGRHARKLAGKLREVFEFAVAGETTASAVLAAQAVAERLLEEGKWLSAFSYGRDYVSDEGRSLTGWSDETLDWATESVRHNPERIASWKRRSGALSEPELVSYLAELANAAGSVAELQRLLLPRL